MGEHIGVKTSLHHQEALWGARSGAKCVSLVTSRAARGPAPHGHPGSRALPSADQGHYLCG